MIMNRFRYIILLTSFALGIFQSCDKNEENISKNEVNLTLSEQTFIFECGAGQSTTVSVQSDKEWTINGITEGVRRWLEVEYLGEAGESVVHVNCIEANPFEEKRVAMLDFVIDGKVKETLMISQYSDPERTVNLSVDRLDFSSASAEEKTFTVVTNKEWVIEDYTEDVSSWAEITPTSGVGPTEVKVKMLQLGTELENRFAQVGFRIDRVHCATLILTQKSSLDITLSVDKVVFSNKGGQSQNLTVTPSTSSIPWYVEGYTDEVKNWLQLSAETGTGVQELNLTTLKDNESDDALSASLRFHLNENIFFEINVVQEAYESSVQLWADGPKWAKCNLGAKEPWLYGDYYAWGAAEPLYISMSWTGPADGGYTPSPTWGKKREDYEPEEGAKYFSGAQFDKYNLRNSPYSTHQSTVNYSKYNKTDKLTSLSGNDDAASAVLDEDWRIPSKAEWQALYDNCTWTWQEAGNLEYNGVTGYKVEGKGDYAGKSIFIPTAGYYLNAELKSAKTNGYYWTSDLHTDVAKAWRPTFSSSAVTIAGSTNRCYGLPVRPIQNN